MKRGWGGEKCGFWNEKEMDLSASSLMKYPEKNGVVGNKTRDNNIFSRRAF